MGEIKDQKIYERVIRSRIQLLMKYPFYGTLALSLRVIEEDSIGTAGVDGTNFYYNPEFVKSLSDAELNWLTAHEVMHCALGHIWRRGSRIHDKFNIASDYAIHCILKENESSDFKMPGKGLYDSKFNGKSSEEIYDILPDPPTIKMGGGGSGQGQGSQGNQSQGGQDGNDGDGQSQNNQGGSGKNQGNGISQGNSGGYPQSLDDHSKWDQPNAQDNGQVKQKEWLEKMISAAEVAEAKSQGSVPGSIARLIGKIKKPQKNWRQLLAEFVQFEVFDYGFLPPDRRYYGLSDVLMPDFNEETEKIQDMVFVIDTSGSIGDRELIAFFSELVGMMDQFHNSVKGHILYTDSRVAADYDFEDVEDILKAKPAGGGGTDMEEAIRYSMDKMDKDEWNVAGICILTDGYTDYEMKESDIPFKVLWLITNEQMTPTYGMVARMKI